jgi:uncharacterized phage protein gp47/JayE
MSPIPVNPASFIGRSRAEVAKRLIEKLPRLTDFTYLGEGSLIKAFLEAVAYELGNAYALLNYSFSQQIVTEASGASLDALGALYGIARRTVTSAVTQSSFYFYLAASANHQTGVPSSTASEAFTIPSGTIISMSDDIIGDIYSFMTSTNVTFNPGDSIHYVGITPTATVASTNISAHKLRVHDYTDTGYENLYCTNPVELNTSTYSENDEDYRARIVDAVRGIASANRIAIRLAALSINHVRDARVVERPYGPATIKVVIAVDAGADGGELTRVYNSVEETRAAGTYAEVVAAQSYPVNINYGFITEDTTYNNVIKASIESAIKIYLSSLGIGVPFRKSKLLSEMSIAAPTAQDVYITSIKINGLTFLGDVYQIPEDGVISLGTLTNV